jgi:hypothetical protein
MQAVAERVSRGIVGDRREADRYFMPELMMAERAAWARPPGGDRPGIMRDRPSSPQQSNTPRQRGEHRDGHHPA